MPHALLPLISLLIACATRTPDAGSIEQQPTLSYPNAERSDTVDTYHGTPVADPYRWLEEMDSDATRTWITSQNRLTESVLAQIQDREAVRDRMTTLWNYERFGTPVRKAGRYLYTHNTGLQDQPVLRIADQLDDEGTILLDPNSFSDDGTASLSNWAMSRDGRYIVYGVSESGSDWKTYRIREVETGRDLDDRVKWAKFTWPSWHPDGSGFWYSRYPEPSGETDGALEHHQVWFHRVGTPQSEDVKVAENPDEPHWGFGHEVTHDGSLEVLYVWQGTDNRNRVWLRSLDSQEDWTRLLNAYDAQYTFIGNEGRRLFFLTDREAPRRRVVAIDLDAPDPEHWTEIIPQGEHTIQGVTRVGNRWVARLLTHAHTQVRLYDLNGDDLGPVALPGVGTARGFDGDPDSSETFFSFERFVQPETSYRLDVDTGEVRAVQTPELAFDGSRYETTQVFYSSRDGTRIPMFITHKKGLDLNGSHPTLLYGYGGFDISILPAFRVYNAVWLEMGGVYASANLRGGGEYGVDWHQAGTGVRKQNVFDDFIAAAEWLVANGYTTREKLAIYGRSNGGLLVGAALTQRPDLFGAALPAVGVHDMLRYHEFTIGWAWASDFGRSDDPEVFDALYAYSPLHNAEAASYPPVLVTTADHDDRVVPLHSYKFAAALQHAQQGPAPVLIRIDTGAGHGAGKSVGMKIDEWTDMLSFLAHALEMDLSW